MMLQLLRKLFCLHIYEYEQMQEIGEHGSVVSAVRIRTKVFCKKVSNGSLLCLLWANFR